MKQLLFPNNIQFWYETLRSMSHIAYGGAERRRRCSPR